MQTKEAPQKSELILIILNTAKPDSLYAPYFKIKDSIESTNSEVEIRIYPLNKPQKEIPPYLNNNSKQQESILIDYCNHFDRTTVLIISEHEFSHSIVSLGSNSNISPAWLVQCVGSILSQSKKDWFIEAKHIPLYRLNWLPENPLLGLFLSHEIPSIEIKLNTDRVNELELICQQILNTPIRENDQHYFLGQLKNFFYVFSEKAVVLSVIFVFTLMLLFIVGFTFAFGKNKDRYFQDLLHYWWVPILYFLITIFSLFIGEKITHLIIISRFKSIEAVHYIPHLGFLIKLSFALFIIFIFENINTLIALPMNSFIYGYMASITCFINIFIFSSLDFSLIFIFLSIYFISFILYRFRFSFIHFLSIFILYSPLYPYIKIGLRMQNENIENLVFASFSTNLFISALLLPLLLIITQFFHSVGVYTKRKKRFLPINLILIFIGCIVSIGITFIAPLWTESKPLNVQIVEHIHANSHNFTLNSPSFYPLEAFIVKNKTDDSVILKNIQALQTTINTESFLNRRILHILAHSPLEVVQYKIEITSTEGLVVYESNTEFSLSNGGLTATFISDLFPANGFEIECSAIQDPNLKVILTLWSLENEENVHIDKFAVQSNYILEIQNECIPPLKGSIRL